MEKEIDEFEEEEENLEKETKEKTLSEKKAEPKPKGKTEDEAPSERYIAFVQEPRIGIVDNITNEVIIEGLADYSTARLEAIKLNILAKIETVTGIN